ncbi:MAG: putative PEP-binding protein, partial [Verrucomicrobiota bacterium]
AEGVGLYRTEFFYLNQQTLPTEEQLYTDYAKVIEGGGEAGVIIRTLDAGGDKIAGGIYQEAEPNPFLGLRGIRLCLERKDWFRTQLRAILRASTKGKVSIMFPLICGLDDFREARSCLEEARAELLKEGIAVSEDMEVGVMIEVPSAVVLAPRLAQEADFLSVGTNDLVQYTLAVDRCNERVSHLFSCHHPAILDSLHHVVSAAEGGEAWAGVCGEMAGDAVSIPLLIGLGFTELSVAPSQVLATKYAILHLSKRECEALVAECQKCDTAEDIRSRCLHFAAERYGKLLEAPESV